MYRAGGVGDGGITGADGLRGSPSRGTRSGDVVIIAGCNVGPTSTFAR